MKYLAPTLIAFVLAGCSSKPQPASLYQLPLPVTTVVSEQSELRQHRLNIEPVQVAGYLNGNGLVMQLSDVELVIARQHLWADSLDKQLQRQLLNRLSLLLPDYQVSTLSAPETVSLQLQIERFHGVQNGNAVLSGRYTLSSGLQQQQLPFQFTVPLTESGYPGLVNALGNGIQQLAEQIASQLMQ